MRIRGHSGRAALALALALLLAAADARADEPGAAPAPAADQIDLAKETNPKAAEEADGAPPPEAPPAAPYKKTVVLDSSVGVMAFLGKFGKVAPTAPWLHVQLGYELLKWLMLFGEGELAFTDTSNKLNPPNTRAFPIFGFGGGARFTVRFTDYLGIYAQAGLGAMKANIATNALGILGFRDAESLGAYLAARLGVEWYQVDRHFALGLNSGIRSAQGFARTGTVKDSPLALDGGVSLRYAF